MRELSKFDSLRRRLSVLVLLTLWQTLPLSRAAAQAQTLTPPRVIEAIDPDYPTEEVDSGLHPIVSLHITLNAEGVVVDAHVDDSAGANFDREALAVIERWRFEPARRGETPIPARIRVAVHFHLPDFDLPPQELEGHDTHEHPGQAPGHGEPGHQHPGEPPEEGAEPGAGPTPSDTSDSDANDSDDAPPETDPAQEPGEPAIAATEGEAGEAVVETSEAQPATGLSDEEARPEEAQEEAPLVGVTAHLQARSAPARSASEHHLDRDLLQAAPRRSSADLLASVPGAFAAQAEGEAVGHRILLRGFDADHGQDIALSVEGIPLNLPSHIHGQGYTDLSIILPEVTRSLRVVEGIYDPAQGDFSVAGSVNFELGVGESERGMRSQSSYGSFNTFRQLFLFAPEGQAEGTFGAAAYSRSDGFGQRRQSETATGIASVEVTEGAYNIRLLALAHGARANLAGVLRVDDIDAERIGFYDAYANASAQAQSAIATRLLLGARIRHRGERGARTSATFWGGYDDFRIQENFTGFNERSRVQPAWVGRGDLIEQRNQTSSLGFQAMHRTGLYEPASWLRGFFTLGLSARLDQIEQAQGLIQAPQNQVWDRRVDAGLVTGDLAGYVDVDWQLSDYLRLRGGVRGDALFFDIDDRLGNFIPAFREESHLPGASRSASGFAVGPRGSLELKPVQTLSFIFSAGQGYRSPQARQLQDGQDAPFTLVRSMDLGFRWDLGRALELDGGRYIRVSGSAFYTDLSDDVVFEPREGRLESVGSTTRMGGVFYIQAKPLSFLTTGLSATFVHATLNEPPPATADNPTPAFEPGQLLPFVPPWVLRADVGANERLMSLDGHDLKYRIGVGFSFLSPRPLPFGQFADPVALLDVAAELSYRWVTLGVQVFNLLDSRYAASEFFYSSNWNPSALPSRLPARHLSAGAPLTLRVNLGLRL